ncbi:MAG: Type secretion system protein [Planctomycetota bacterium]
MQNESSLDRQRLKTKLRRRGSGFTLQQLIYMIFIFGLFFGLIRLFRNHLGSLAVFLMAFGVTLFVGLVVTMKRRKAGFQDAFLELVATSYQSGLPLELALRSFAHQAGYFYGRRLIRLADRIASGMPLSDAVALTPGILPLEMRALFRVAESNGSSPETLQKISRSRWSRIDALSPLVNSIIYFVVVLWKVSLVLLFLGYFIAPKMLAIFNDFSTSLPNFTVSFMSFLSGTSQVYLSYPILGFIFLLSYQFSGPILIVIGLYICILFNSGRGLGFFGRFVPWMTTGERASVLRGLADTIRAQRPVNDCLQIFSDWAMRSTVRRRSLRANRAILNGDDWIAALNAEGFLNQSEVGMIQSSVDAGRVSWALDQLADGIESRRNYQFRLMNELMTPALTLLIASLVLITCMAYFGPLVKLIQALAS